MDTDKQKLRQILKKRHRSLSSEEMAAKSRRIADKLMQAVDWSQVRKMHIYHSVADWKEVDSSIVVKKIQEKYSQIQIEFASTNKNAIIPKNKFDLIILPVLGFDKSNHRLGWGGGWYDRFLVAQPQALKIGLAFQNGFVETSLPHEPHDIPLDKVITEI